MHELVPLVLTVVDLAGGSSAAEEWIDAMSADGLSALDRLPLSSDTKLVLKSQAMDSQIVDESGDPNRPKMAQLRIVYDILAAVPPPMTRGVKAERLVFTAPRAVQGLLSPSERLELLVSDIVRMATQSVVLGGPFWNQEGFEALRPVLEPALSTRQVTCTIYAHPFDEDNDSRLRDFANELSQSGSVELWWYRGPGRSLMHAKFCVSDDSYGYLGSANLTSYGLGQHVELGVKLAPSQAHELAAFLQALRSANMFRRDRAIGRSTG